VCGEWVRELLRLAQKEYSIRNATDSGILGCVPFTFGIECDVFEDADRR
jgi:hypothetical protein